MSIKDLAEMIDIGFGILITLGGILWLCLYIKLEKVYDELKEKRKEKKEVKHGEWQEVNRWECSTHSVTDMKCSICHHYSSQVLPHKTTCTYDFCPNCGADMREWKKEEGRKREADMLERRKRRERGEIE